MTNLETNRKIVTDIIEFDSLLITKLGGAIRNYNSVYDWFIDSEKKNKIYAFGARLSDIEKTQKRIKDLYAKNIKTLKSLIATLGNYPELTETKAIYSKILKNVETALKSSEDWMNAEFDCFDEFMKYMKKTGKIDKKKISKFESNEIRHLYGSMEGKYNSLYTGNIPHSLIKAWGKDGYSLARGEKTQLGVNFKNFRKDCDCIITNVTKYIKWSEKTLNKTNLENNMDKVIKDAFKTAGDLHNAVNSVITTAEKTLLPGLNMKSEANADLVRLKEISNDINRWGEDLAGYLSGECKTTPDIKKYEINSLASILKSLLSKISWMAFGEKFGW